MIRFLLTRGYGSTLRTVRKSLLGASISLMNYDRLLRARWLRRGTYIFTDLDRLGSWDVEQASHMYLHLKNAGLKVLNNPARVKCRFALLRALHAAGLNDFNVYRVDEMGLPMRFPVFVRKLNGHHGPLSGLLETGAEVQKAVTAAIDAGTPEENIGIIEFAAEPLRPGLYRKLAAFRLGRTIVPHISVHDSSWLVKYGTLGIAGEELYQEELNLIRTNPFAGHLQKVFDVAGIDYGRADFGFYHGRIQVYEINTNPHVAAPDPHPSPSRIESMRVGWENYLEALRALDTPGGWPITVPNGKLQRGRVLKNLLVHTRKVH